MSPERLILLIATFGLIFLKTSTAGTCSALELETKVFLEEENELLRQRLRAEHLAAYEYNINVTESNRQTMIATATENAKAKKEVAVKLKQKSYADNKDENTARQLKKLERLTFDVLPELEFKEIHNAISAMQMNYAKAQVCAWQEPDKCNLTLEPHINERLRNSRNAEELAHYWTAWYDAAGTPMLEHFKTYIRLSRKAAQLNNFTSYAEDWISYYEDPDFEEKLDAVYQTLLPFYRELHGYVRYRLHAHYGADVVPAQGPIPMHLLGNMWAQQWHENIDLYTPYPDVPFINVKSELIKQGYTVRKLFELGDDFFKSLNMRELPASFWNLSVLVRPEDRAIVCHASAWDLFENSDVRIKMCTEVDTHYLYVVHHELGHIQYYLQYEHQPAVFRNAPNPGFHEAIGDVISLSVSTLKHLHRIGLVSKGSLEEKGRINELFKAAIQKVVFLPFAYHLDKYRFGVFRGEINKTVWNCEFWKMRAELTGLQPPVKRSDLDFDPPAKYHIDADVEYLRYFAAHIFQFQFFKALCIKAGQYVPGDPEKTFDNCDIYESEEAGKAFSNFLSLGSSKHWKVALKELTGETDMDPAALLEYFKPLYEWLRAENIKHSVPLGWHGADTAYEFKRSSDSSKATEKNTATPAAPPASNSLEKKSSPEVVPASFNAPPPQHSKSIGAASMAFSLPANPDLINTAIAAGLTAAAVEAAAAANQRDQSQLYDAELSAGNPTAVEPAPPALLHKRGINLAQQQQQQQQYSNMVDDAYYANSPYLTAAALPVDGVWADEIDPAVGYAQLQDLDDYIATAQHAPSYRSRSFDSLQSLNANPYLEPLPYASRYYGMSADRSKRSNANSNKFNRYAELRAKLTPADMLALVALVEAGEREHNSGQKQDNDIVDDNNLYNPQNYYNGNLGAYDYPAVVVGNVNEEDSDDDLNIGVAPASLYEPSALLDYYGTPVNFEALPKYELTAPRDHKYSNRNRFAVKRFMVAKKSRPLGKFLNEPVAKPSISFAPSFDQYY